MTKAGRSLLLPLIPVNPHVMRRPPHGDDVNLAVAGQVRRGQILDGDAAFVDQVAFPFRALVVERLVDADAALFAGLVAEIIADADDEFVAAVTVEISAPHGVSPLELVVKDVAGPQFLWIVGLGVNDNLVAVPRLDRGDERFAVLEFALLDFARAETALGVRLIAFADMARGPFAVLVALQAAAALVACV